MTTPMSSPQVIRPDEVDAFAAQLEALRLEAAKPGSHVAINVPVQLCAPGGGPRPKMTAREEAQFILRFRAEVAAIKSEDQS